MSDANNNTTTSRSAATRHVRKRKRRPASRRPHRPGAARARRHGQIVIVTATALFANCFCYSDALTTTATSNAIESASPGARHFRENPLFLNKIPTAHSSTLTLSRVQARKRLRAVIPFSRGRGKENRKEHQERALPGHVTSGARWRFRLRLHADRRPGRSRGADWLRWRAARRLGGAERAVRTCARRRREREK